MANILANILVYGDIHLSSKNYGGHIDYPKESLNYFKRITEFVKDNSITHLIGLGDLTYGRFNTLEYRQQVEMELIKQYKLVNGNRYELKGNHDTASYGMTEYEYYINKKYIKPAINLAIGNLNLNMINYGDIESNELLPIDETKENVILCHDYVKFEKTKLPPFGTAKILDDLDKWCGVKTILCGHIHAPKQFSGLICDKEATVTFLGCPSRPSYESKDMPETVYLTQIIVYDDNTVETKYIDFELIPLNESFNVELINNKKKKKDLTTVDISDVARSLAEHKLQVGSPEETIMSMKVEDKYKDKAIELLKSI